MSGRTVFDVPSLGDVSIPITPTSIDNMVIGASVPAAGTFTTIIASTVVAGTVVASNIAIPDNITVTGTLNAANVTATAVVASTLTVTAVTGPVTVSGNVIVSGGYLSETINPSITAGSVGATWASGVALTAQINIVVTSPNPSTTSAVALPSVAVAGFGTIIQVLNRSTKTVGVWPSPLDTFDGGATGTVYLIVPSSGGVWIAASATGWVTNVLGTIA